MTCKTRNCATGTGLGITDRQAAEKVAKNGEMHSYDHIILFLPLGPNAAWTVFILQGTAQGRSSDLSPLRFHAFPVMM